MEEWRTPIQVEGRVRRNEDGYLVEEAASRLIAGCLIAPGQFITVPGLLDQAASQRPDEQATLYLPRGVTLSVGDVVRVPDGHPLAGTWAVEDGISPWPRGVAVTLSRR